LSFIPEKPILYDKLEIQRTFAFPAPLDSGLLLAIVHEFRSFNHTIASKGSSKHHLYLPVPISIETLEADRTVLANVLKLEIYQRGFTNKYIFLNESDKVNVRIDSLLEINKKTGIIKNQKTLELSDENQLCLAKHFKLSDSGYFPGLRVKFISKDNYGVFATQPIPENTFLCLYSGSIHSSKSCLFGPDNDQFDLTYKDKCDKSAVIKAGYVTNIARFINNVNDGQLPNVRPQRSSNFDPSNKANMAILLISTRSILPEDQLFYNYNSYLVREKTLQFQPRHIHLKRHLTLDLWGHIFFMRCLFHAGGLP
jgi:hypothetical protein